MPSYTRGKRRDQTVAIKVGTNSYYLFKSKDLSSIPGVSESDLAVLGRIVLDDTASNLPQGALAFLRANAPKPPRVVKKLNNSLDNVQSSVGTFCSSDTLRTALRSGWNLQKDAIEVQITTKGKKITVIAELSNNLLYAFPLNKADFEAYGRSLGLVSGEIINTDAERERLVVASSLPRPGRAKLTLENGSDFATFCSHFADLDGGFRRISKERLI
jgi:hypothetical protein